MRAVREAQASSSPTILPTLSVSPAYWWCNTNITKIGILRSQWTRVCTLRSAWRGQKSKLTQLKGPPTPAAIPLLGDPVESRDEGRVINEMLFKDLTWHSLMPVMWVPQAPFLDNLRAPVYLFQNRIWLVVSHKDAGYSVGCNYEDIQHIQIYLYSSTLQYVYLHLCTWMEMAEILCKNIFP